MLNYSKRNKFLGLTEPVKKVQQSERPQDLGDDVESSYIKILDHLINGYFGEQFPAITDEDTAQEVQELFSSHQKGFLHDLECIPEELGVVFHEISARLSKLSTQQRSEFFQRYTLPDTKDLNIHDFSDKIWNLMDTDNELREMVLKPKWADTINTLQQKYPECSDLLHSLLKLLCGYRALFTKTGMVAFGLGHAYSEFRVFLRDTSKKLSKMIGDEFFLFQMEINMLNSMPRYWQTNAERYFTPFVGMKTSHVFKMWNLIQSIDRPDEYCHKTSELFYLGKAQEMVSTMLHMKQDVFETFRQFYTMLAKRVDQYLGEQKFRMC